MKDRIFAMMFLLVSAAGYIGAEAPPDTAWVRVFNRDGCSGSFGHGCVVDSDRNILYITGTTTCLATKADIMALKLNSANGQFMDTLIYDDSLHLNDWGYSCDLNIDSNYLYVSGTSSLDSNSWVFVKYDINTNAEIWAKHYKIFGESDYAWKSKLSNDNYYYTAGWTNSVNKDGILFKINAQNGDPIWAKRFAAESDSFDGYFGLTISENDSILYLCGSSNNGSYRVGFVAAYSAVNGDSLWAHNYDFGLPTEVNPGLHDCELSLLQNKLYIAGFDKQKGRLLALDPSSGDTIWTTAFPSQDTTIFYSCHLDTTQKYLYVAGVGGSDRDTQQCLVVKYDATTGDTVWSLRIVPPNVEFTEIFSCDVDQNNDLYLGGRAYDGSTYKMIAIKLNIGVTGVGGNPGGENLPLSLTLGQCVPNPFGLKTAINYQTRESRRVELKIYNLAGQLVRTLVDAPQSAGSHAAEWDGRDQRGEKAKNGVYIVKISSGESVKYGKVLLIR